MPIRTRFAAAACAIVSAALVGHAQIAAPPSATLTPLVERDPVQAGATARVALQVSLPEGLHVQSNRPRDPNLIPTTLTVQPPDGISPTEIVFPPPIDFDQAGASQPLAVFEREFAIGMQFQLAKTLAAGTVSVPGRFRYQACNDTVCFAPRTVDFTWTFRVGSSGDRQAGRVARSEVFDRIAFGGGEAPSSAPVPSSTPAISAPSGEPAAATLDDFTVLGTAEGYLGTTAFITFIRNAENGVKERGLFEGRGPAAILLIVFFGGLALNLTPCVLPMIPINLAIIGAGTRAGSRGRGFLLGGTYGAAMAIVYGALGLIVILTAGTFGTINASPWFNAAIAAIFVVLALAMFDIFTIDFSGLSSRFAVNESNRGSLLVAFGMGSIAALLAGACVAPVVVQVVLFASNLYAAGTPAALALPFVLGLGMAIPWPIAGAGIAALPAPGAWMVRVKQVFGVLILVTAVYYGYEAYTLFANRWVDASEVSASVQEKLSKEGWQPLGAGLATAKREGKPVLIDMWATWCKNCLTMDKTTLQSEEVKAALSGYVKIKFQAEDPEEPSVRAVMRRFGAIGLPTYVILRPSS
jgi:cytochrome c biogenesis protein CcdA/thiol-disulfide isomerase/thioredoxin